MATILSRVKQLIFGSTGDVAGFGKIGSKIAGSPVKTKDLALMQSLSLYLEGLQAITNSNVPYLQDQNSLFYLITSQLAYMFQNGVPEYDATTDYFNLISFVQVNGVIYQSIAGDGTTPNTGNAPASSPTKWRNVDPYTIKTDLASEVTRATTAEGVNAAAIAAETSRAEAAESAISSASALTYVQTTVEEAGLTWDPTDAYILDKANIGNSHGVGELRTFDTPQTQVTFPAAKSSAHTGYPRYNPLIARDVDKTISTSQSVKLVAEFRARQLSIGGVTGFACTVSGSTLTFANTTVLNQFLAAVNNEGLVRRWFSSNQSATFAASGPDLTGMTITLLLSGVATEFAMTSVSTGSHTIGVSGSPDSGAQTAHVYPYRKAGSGDIQLPGLSGFVSVGANDYDALENGMYRHMDTGQLHNHRAYNAGSEGLTGGTSAQFNVVAANTIAFSNTANTVKEAIADGGNGDYRGAKNFSPRTHTVFYYTHVPDLMASA